MYHHLSSALFPKEIYYLSYFCSLVYSMSISSGSFNTLSLSMVLSNLIMMCLGLVFFRFLLLEVCEFLRFLNVSFSSNLKASPIISSNIFF